MKFIDKLLHRRPKHRISNLVWLTVGTLTITIVILAVALWLYRSSGAAQLDLSRPEYDGLREQAKIGEDDDFSANGQIDKETIKEFTKLYDARAEKINAIKAFTPEPIGNQTLSLGE